MYAQSSQLNLGRIGVAPYEKGPSLPPHDLKPQDPDLAAIHCLCVAKIVSDQDQAAFASLFDYFGPRVKSFLISRKLDAAAADDLAQEVMLTVWRKAHLFRPEKASVSTWIFTIARNRMIDDLRGEARRARLDAADPSQEQAAPATPEEEAINSSEAAEVLSALSTLPPAQAKLVRLSFMEGHSHHEIAERMALPLGTVKSRIRLARQRLADYFGARS